MDKQFLVYIVIGILYFLFNRLKKKSPEREEESERPYDKAPQSNRPKPITFEELLKEITEGKKSQSSPPVVEKREDYKPVRPKPTYVDYDDDIEPEEKSLEEITFDDKRSTEIYENAKKLAFNRPSLEESLKPAEVNSTYAKFKEFEIKGDRNILEEFAKDLRDPQGLKKAFILSEVLNRRHF